MPTLQAGRARKTDDVAVIDNTLNTYAHEPGVFACPADSAGLAANTGTSYYWDIALNGQSAAALNFLTFSDHSRIPVLSDKQGFHVYEANKVNLLYADGHATKDLNFVTSRCSGSTASRSPFAANRRWIDLSLEVTRARCSACSATTARARARPSA